MSSRTCGQLMAIATQHQHPVLWCTAGKQSLTLLHLWRSLDLSATVFYNDLDGGFPGVRTHLERCCTMWGVEDLRVVRPALSFDDYVQQMGYPVERLPEAVPEGMRLSNSWQCTWIRQALPLLVATLESQADAIITGSRGGDHPLFAAMGEVYDASDIYGFVRYNPLYTWSAQQVWDYIDAKRIPLPDHYRLKRDATYLWPDCLACTRRPEHWTMLKEQYPEVYRRYWPEVAAIVGKEP